MCVMVNCVGDYDGNNSLTFALISLLAKTPQKFFTKCTKRWLSEKFGHKFVAIDFMSPAKQSKKRRREKGL